MMASMEDLEFEARYRSWAALRRDMEQQLSMGGLLLRTEVEAPLYTEVSLTLVSPAEASLKIQAQVLQQIPGQGLALQLKDVDGEMQRELSGWFAMAKEDQELEGDPEIVQGGAEVQNGKSTGASEPKAAYLQIEEMRGAEKRRAALRGKKDMRILLIRDRNKTIHPFVLKNPSITLDEVEQIAKMPGVNPDVLRLIARNRDWTRSTTIIRNLVRNPKTPLGDALKLMDKLPTNEIRALAKSSNVRGPIQQKARKTINS